MMKFPPKILKLSAPYIISPLIYFCNAIINCGIIPDRLKYAIIKPIFKKVMTMK